MSGGELAGKALVGYNIYRSESEVGPYDYLETVPVDETTYEDHSIHGGERHWYVVTATYHQEESGYCNEDHGTARSMLPPMSIDDLQAFLEIDDLRLTWSPVSLDTAGYSKTADHYTIYRITDPGAAISDLDSVGASSGEEYLDPGAAGDTLVQYFYVVRAVDIDGVKSIESNRVGEFDVLMQNGMK